MSIANYIKDDLTVRLTTGQELPSQLTLDSLAEHYQVSFTPVRAAVAELVQEGLLEKGPNRRLVVKAVRTVDASSSPVLLPEPPKDPYDLVADDLIRLSLEEKPIYLREEATAEKYGVSRSMIRNVLHRLAGEGILDHIPRRGWRLRPFRQVDLQAYIEVRHSLEMTALDLAYSRLNPSRLQQILDLNPHPLSVGEDELLRVDESLHDYFIDTSGNSYIREFFERHGRYYQLLFQWEDHDRRAAEETIHQHREILTALLGRDLAVARKALSHHILNNHPILNPSRSGLENEGEGHQGEVESRPQSLHLRNSS